MLCKSVEHAIGIMVWRARVYIGKAIHHPNANFLLDQVRGMSEERQADLFQTRQSDFYGPYGAPSVMVGHTNSRRSHAGHWSE